MGDLQLLAAGEAEHIDVSRPAVVQIEQGNRAVSSLELDRLAHLFGRDIRDFVAESFEGGDALAAVFRAGFLMPEEGVREFVAGLGKGSPSRPSLSVFDGEAGLRVEGRTPPGSQALQLYDLVQIAHHFRVSNIARLYRLRNLKLLTDAEFEHLRGLDESGRSRELAAALGLPETDHEEARNWFRHRVLGLALEAYRREEISRGKLVELAAMLGVDRELVELLIEEAGLDEQETEGRPER